MSTTLFSNQYFSDNINICVSPEYEGISALHVPPHWSHTFSLRQINNNVASSAIPPPPFSGYVVQFDLPYL